MYVPSAKLTVEGEIAVIRRKGGKLDSIRGEHITGQPGLGD